MYDLIILGGGPAGAAGAVYAARKQLKTAIIAYEFAGQSVVSETIYNWIGTKEISGGDLAQNLKDHIFYYKGPFLDIFEGEKIKDIEKIDNHFKVITENNKTYEGKSILIATGSGRRKLEAINADKFEHKGITYCASCDGPMFADMDVLVIGGGNAAFETALQLLAYCKSVILIHRSENFRADEITVEKTKNNPKFKAITNAEVIRIDGDNFANSLTYKDKITGETITIPTSGIFVEIGQIPNTSFAKNVVSLDEIGKIKVDPINQAGETEGIWAAGDCSNGRYHQNNIAVGDAVKAIEDIYIWLHKNK
ncbi:TPA: FAD-binding protein [Candidatus Nomurabacteria bacterium]|nr:MAG: Alkyl hydroperoxide reductase [Parcubacteria bacterium RAAC4_OD1_1]HCY26479.1 FAD-binding protein [Candidatus Nomurabacteria bacterium]